MDLQRRIWSQKGIVLISLTVMVIFFLMGTASPLMSNLPDSVPMRAVSANEFFLQVFGNNFLAGLAILLGSVSYCVISFCVVGYSAFTIGVSFMTFASTHTLFDAFILIAPHGVIEIIWVCLLTLSASEISRGLYEFLAEKDAGTTVNINGNVYRRIMISFILIVLGAFIEAFVSLPIYLCFINR